MYNIGDLAGMAGISSRTLRHYDRIGLLRPEHRTLSGYRMYTSEDAFRLQQILFFRELEFSLADIACLMKDPGFDRENALEKQAVLLEKRADRFAALACSARSTLENSTLPELYRKGENKMEDKELFQAFDYDRMMEDQKKWQPEVEERWENTDAYRISKKRTSHYTKDDWRHIQERQAPDLAELTSLFSAGVLPGDPRIQRIVERARSFIDKTFYPCSWEMFRGLGEVYSVDSRFAAFYDRLAAGLSGFYSEAIKIRCDAEDAAKKAE